MGARFGETLDMFEAPIHEAIGAKPRNLGQRQLAVLNVLKDGAWHSTVELSVSSSGGSEGTRRLRELRALGYQVEKRKKADSTQFEYRLIGVPS